MNDTQANLLRLLATRDSYAPTDRWEKAAMTRLLNKGLVKFVATGRYALSEHGELQQGLLRLADPQEPQP